MGDIAEQQVDLRELHNHGNFLAPPTFSFSTSNEIETHHTIHSAEGVAYPPQIHTELHTEQKRRPTCPVQIAAFKFSQPVEVSGQFSPAEIKARDGQKILFRYDSYDVIYFFMCSSWMIKK